MLVQIRMYFGHKLPQCNRRSILTLNDKWGRAEVDGYPLQADYHTTA